MLEEEGPTRHALAAKTRWTTTLGKERPRFLHENPVFEPGFYGGDRSDPRWERNPVLKSGGFWW